MRFRTRLDRHNSRRRERLNKIQPTIELFEPRMLLATGLVQGYAYGPTSRQQSYRRNCRVAG